MAHAHDLGRRGEALALGFLEAVGYECLARGYRVPGGEIDLVVGRGDEVVFVEVKTRGPGALDRPEAWVDRRKLRLIRRAAALFLREHRPAGPRRLRIDVIGISLRGEGKGMVLRHLRGVG